MHIEFINDDAAYLNWCTANPSGYVLNTRAIPDPNYMVLHKTSCHTVRTYPNMEINAGGFTGKAYVKICAETIGELRSWVKTQAHPDGTFSKECGICKP